MGQETSALQMRASDAEREETAARLRDQFAEGRLTLNELQERLEKTYASKTVGELTELTADLPSHSPGSAGPLGTEAKLAPRRQRTAKRVAGYVVLMLFLTLIWAATGGHGSFWPIWPIIVGGFILAMDLLGIERGRTRRYRRYERLHGSLEGRAESTEDDERARLP